MKNAHYLGFLLWLVASFFSLKLVGMLYLWFDDVGVVFKIFLLISSVLVWLIELYKIPLSLMLLMGKNTNNLNLIATTYSVIGFVGLLSSYLYNDLELLINEGGAFNKSLSVSFLFILVIMLTKGFVFMPKSQKFHSK